MSASPSSISAASASRAEGGGRPSCRAARPAALRPRSALEQRHELRLHLGREQRLDRLDQDVAAPIVRRSAESALERCDALVVVAHGAERQQRAEPLGDPLFQAAQQQRRRVFRAERGPEHDRVAHPVELARVEIVECGRVDFELAEDRRDRFSLRRGPELVLHQQRLGRLGPEGDEPLAGGGRLLRISRGERGHQARRLFHRAGVSQEPKRRGAHSRVAIVEPTRHALRARMRRPVVAPRHPRERLRRLGAIGTLLEPLGEQLQTSVPLLVGLRRQQHRAQLLARGAPHEHIAPAQRAAQHGVQIRDARRRFPAPVKLRDGGQSDRRLPVAERAPEDLGGSAVLVPGAARAAGEPRVYLDQIGAFLGGDARRLGEHPGEGRHRPVTARVPGRQRLHQAVERVDQKFARLLGSLLQRLGEHARSDRRFGIGDQIDGGAAHARVGTGEAGRQGPHGSGVEERCLVGPDTGQTALRRSLQQQSRVGAPERERSDQPDGGDRNRRVRDGLNAAQRESEQHGGVAESGSHPLHGPLEQRGRLRGAGFPGRG